MQNVSIWVWVAAACALALILVLAGIMIATRPGREQPPPAAPAPGPGVFWHVVEEYVPGGGDRPGRWVETRRTRVRAEAEREWERLRREDPEHQDDVRIVTTTADAARATRPAPVPQPTRSPERLTFTTSPETAPLYDRLVKFARTDGVFGIVSERLYLRILGQRPDPTLGPEDRIQYAMRHGDPSLVPVFTGMLRQDGGRDRLENHMTHFLMGALGGPKRYSGRGMAAAHGGLGITGGQFDRVIGHVVTVLRDLDVPPAWIAEVGDTVAPLREAIVVAPAPA